MVLLLDLPSDVVGAVVAPFVNPSVVCTREDVRDPVALMCTCRWMRALFRAREFWSAALAGVAKTMHRVLQSRDHFHDLPIGPDERFFALFRKYISTFPGWTYYKFDVVPLAAARIVERYLLCEEKARILLRAALFGIALTNSLCIYEIALQTYENDCNQYDDPDYGSSKKRRKRAPLPPVRPKIPDIRWGDECFDLGIHVHMQWLQCHLVERKNRSTVGWNKLYS